MNRHRLRAVILNMGLETSQMAVIMNAAERYAESAFLAGKHGNFMDYEDYTSARAGEARNINRPEMRVHESKINQ